jgi:signal transduction histidine kinase
MRAFSSPPGAGILPLDPAQHRELRWAIPLWAERGLIGALLLGEKRDGGLYTQEEIEVARAGAERIVDMLAGEQMARRLMELQRRRGVETRVMDLKTRRALHDDVLPTLHAAALRLNSLSHNEPAVGEAIQALADVHRQIAALIHAPTPTAIPNGCNLLEALRIVVDQEFAGEFESVSWKVADELPSLEPLTQEVVFCAAREAVRNAAVHGRGERSERLLNLTLEIRHDDALSVAVKDDGVGLAFPLRFSEGPESEPPTGSGGGLALHSTMLAIVGGYLVVESTPDGGTQVVITLPLKPPSDSS